MDRVEIIKRIARRMNVSSYLEIGVNDGYNFLRIPCWNKAGVDPAFRITSSYKLKRTLQNPTNIGNRYFTMTSDRFFSEYAAEVFPEGIDLVFIDGLHTFRQSLTDVQNSLKFLKRRGVIVMHDCSPPDASAAFPSETLEEAKEKNPFGWKGNWCGDVWKTIPYIRASDPSLAVTVIDCDFGIGIIRKGNGANHFPLTIDECAGLTYSDLEKNRAMLLNLKDPEYLTEIIRSI